MVSELQTRPPMNHPYTNHKQLRAMLFPISIVAINLEGFEVILANNFDNKPLCFFSISI